jgi:hypothetical protein
VDDNKPYGGMVSNSQDILGFNFKSYFTNCSVQFRNETWTDQTLVFGSSVHTAVATKFPRKLIIK